MERGSNMKKLIVLITCLFLMGCVTAGLDGRVSHLEKELKRIEMMAAAGGAAATDRIWPFYGLIGGGNALDGIAEGSIGDNDSALGRDSDGYGYFHTWNKDDENVSDPPSIIKPVGGDGTGSWLNVPRWYAEAFYSSAADSYHYVDPSNSSAFPTGMAEGSVTCIDTRDACFIYDGSSWWPLFTGNYVAYDTSQTVAADACWGGVITNSGAPANVILTLPSAVQGMRCTFAIVDDPDNITIQENAGSSDTIFRLAHIVLSEDEDSVTLYAISSSTWIVIGDSGAPNYVE